MVKRIYTLTSAAKELHLSERHLIRYIKARTNWKPSRVGSRMAYILSPEQVQTLKQFTDLKQVERASA